MSLSGIQLWSCNDPAVFFSVMVNKSVNISEENNSFSYMQEFSLIKNFKNQYETQLYLIQHE